MLHREGGALSFLASLKSLRLAVSFSGGKDSLVALDLSIRVGIRKVVFCDTTIEFDETVRYIKTVEDFYGIEIERVSAPVDFFSMITHVGIPSRRLRWCCDVLKFGPVARYAIDNRIFGFVTGLRQDESTRRKNYRAIDENPMVPAKQINPILEWTGDDVWRYIKRYRLPVNPLYKHFDRIGCWCCPYRTEADWGKIEELFPEKIEHLKKKITEFAKKVKIKDVEEFVEGRGWTRWAGHVRKRSVGTLSLCPSGEHTVVAVGGDPRQMQRILKILPILTKDFSITGNRLRIVIDQDDKQRLNILLEKALNCCACGACLSLCRVGALNVDNDSVYVDESRCSGCGRCLISSSDSLRGACIIRNYSSTRLSLVETRLG